MRSGLGVSVSRSLLAGPARKARGAFRRAQALVGAGPDTSCFDLYDARTLTGLLGEAGIPPLPTSGRQAHRSVAEAMRDVLGLLANRRTGLRDRFPRALSDGAGGPFAAWCERGLSPAGSANVRAAFAADPSRRVGRVYELREDLRATWPLALTPAQRGEYLRWLLTFGQADFAVTPEAALWFLFEAAEDPARGLADTFRLQPAWQAAVPHGITRFGWDELKQWVGQEYGIKSRWLRRATLPPQYRPWDELRFLLAARPELRERCPADPAAAVGWLKGLRLPQADPAWLAALADDVRSGFAGRPGVNIVGLFRYTSGLQQAVRGSVAALHHTGTRTALRDFPVVFLREPRDRERFDDLEPFDVTVLNTGIDMPVPEVYRKSGLHPRPGVYRVATWWWEMDQLPPKWQDRAADVDEIWAPTRFIAGAMRAAFPGKPVHPMLPGVQLSPFDPLPKAYFGLDPSKFTFGFVFDMNSRMQRKNPLALIRAFRTAFPKSAPVELVLKVSPPESYYADQWELLRAAAADAGVTILDRVLTRAELLGFVNALDGYVSLHRSEGFGLTCAEAMLLGKPTVATAYSGNLDFMTEANSYLVRANLVTLEEDIDPYFRGGTWADPCVDHAAELMARIVERPDEARVVGLRGKAEAVALLSVAAAGERLTTRLQEIRARGARYCVPS